MFKKLFNKVSNNPYVSKISNNPFIQKTTNDLVNKNINKYITPLDKKVNVFDPASVKNAAVQSFYKNPVVNSFIDNPINTLTGFLK